MKILTKIALASSILAAAVPAFAGVTVTSPSNGATVGSSFPLSASAANCGGQGVSVMGYSIDSSAQTNLYNGSSLNVTATSPTGNHTVHVKAWGNAGAVCVTDVALNVSSGSNGSGPSIPGNAVSVSSIQTFDNWTVTKDSGTPGSASGAMALTSNPSMGGQTRKFTTSTSSYGGMRYSANFGDDNQSQNFVYDAWVYVDNSIGNVANLEMDLNQTMANGQTAIFGFQCDGYSNTWDVTANTGSAQSPNDQWVHTGAYCKASSWGQNTWHHVQVQYSRDGSGNINYKSVWLDGLQEPINMTVFSGFALGWGPALLTNFQVDGVGSGGTSNIYVDNLTVYRW